MRVKFIACLALAILLLSTTAASASLFSFNFPVIKPVYASNDGDMGDMIGLIHDVVGFTDKEITDHGANASTAAESLPDASKLSAPLSAIPGPDMFMAAMVPPVISDAAVKNKINKTLVGTNITYSNLAGKPINYTIMPDSIKSIEKTVYKGKLAWKVRVGEGMAWDITMDATGSKILDRKQLFYT